VTSPVDENAMADETEQLSVGGDSLSADELFELARNKTKEGRESLFAMVSDLFFDEDRVLSDRERALMGEILRRLVHAVEMSVRRNLSMRMAERTDAPHDLIVDLANDDIEVAHAILLRSDVLQDTDLIEVIRHRTMEHQLSVAARRSVSEDVAEALVDTGNEDVIATLLHNNGAGLSREVMEYLVGESKRVDRYQNPLVQRGDLPPDLAQRMYWWVTAALRKHIVENFSIDATDLDAALDEATEGALKKEAKAVEKPDEAESLIDRLVDLGELTPGLLVRSLGQGEVALFETGLARLAGLRRQLVRRILYEPGGEGLAILCRALGIEREMFSNIYQLSRKAKDVKNLPDSKEIENVLKFFDKTKQWDAAKVLKRWQRSSDYLYALKKLDGEA
jgi:uncharacterized protein (DUF2336 family)